MSKTLPMDLVILNLWKIIHDKYFNVSDTLDLARWGWTTLVLDPTILYEATSSTSLNAACRVVQLVDKVRY